MKHNELFNLLFDTFTKVFTKWTKKNYKKESLIDIAQQLNLFAKKVNEQANILEEEYKRDIRQK